MTPQASAIQWQVLCKATGLKIDGCGCVYWSDVGLDGGQTNSHRIRYVMSESFKKITGWWPHWQNGNGTFVLSTEKSNGHFASSVGLWTMSDVDVHPCSTAKNGHYSTSRQVWLWNVMKSFPSLKLSKRINCLSSTKVRVPKKKEGPIVLLPLFQGNSQKMLQYYKMQHFLSTVSPFWEVL